MTGTIANNLNKIVKPLKSQLIDLIRVRGAISVADYMKIVLINPTSGFYMNEDVFGVKGHFTTNPEISQIFGELIGAWVVNEWKRFGSLEPLRIAELGPGRGTLMSDIYRTVKKLKVTKTDVQVNLIEISNKLREIQEENLKDIRNIKWNTHINAMDEVKDGFTAFIAHEYFDALPVHKFMKVPGKNYWREILIDYDDKENLRYVLANTVSPSHLLLPEDLKGDHVEINPEASMQVQRIAKHLNSSGAGCMLICDYGFEDDDYTQDRDTFRAFRNHEMCHPLDEPGSADLTADLDFGYLKKQVMEDSLIFGSVTQKQYLIQCGIQARLETLMKSNKHNHEDLKTSAEMLIEQMGQRYRIMAMFPKNADNLFVDDPPAGFSEA